MFVLIVKYLHLRFLVFLLSNVELVCEMENKETQASLATNLAYPEGSGCSLFSVCSHEVYRFLWTVDLLG